LMIWMTLILKRMGERPTEKSISHSSDSAASGRAVFD
jgi:hypothetical protein